MSQEVYYKISGNRLTEMADHIRTMVGTNKEMTPEDMVYWLGRIIYLPQGFAESTLALAFSSNAVGVLPVVQKGMASSVLTLSFSSSAIGVLLEG